VVESETMRTGCVTTRGSARNPDRLSRPEQMDTLAAIATQQPNEGSLENRIDVSIELVGDESIG